MSTVVEVPSALAPKLRDEYTGRLWAGAVTWLGAALPLTAIAFAADARRAIAGYYAGLVVVITIGLGALFFILLQHLLHAQWSVRARRYMEWVSSVLPWCMLLFVPVAASADSLFPWMSPNDLDLGDFAQRWLQAGSFFLRTVLYVGLWTLLGRWYCRQSRDQDRRDDPLPTQRMRAWSGPAMIVFSLTVSMAAFDWLMSLQPTWRSSIFAVYVFAGAVTSSLATLALITIGVQQHESDSLPRHDSPTGCARGQSQDPIGLRHDIAKLLFAFVFFWGYIAYCQYFLIWYAGVPAERVFYDIRSAPGWRELSLVLVLLHFILPFLLLLSRTAKRSVRLLRVASLIVLAAHALDMYWLVVPAIDDRPSWLDFASASLPISVLVAVVTRHVANEELHPTPRRLRAETQTAGSFSEEAAS